MAKRGELHAGTSGWSYSDWKGPFYPDDLPSKEFLGFYADRFNSAEINNSFYQLPETDTLQAWKQQAGSQFTFAVKASRYITHQKKLKDPEEPVQRFLKRVEVLKTKLGPVLFQLPGNWKANVERLDQFLDVLPAGKRYTFEFRDEDWHRDEVYERLSKRNAAFCVYDYAGRQSPRELTASFAYVRLHGPTSDAYKGSYDDAALDDWADTIDGWLSIGKDVYIYFDNDEKGYAPHDAARLLKRLNHQ